MLRTCLTPLPDEKKHWLVAAARRSRRTPEAAAIVIDAVERAETRPEHSHLDKLME
jgi:hypothetical protein